MSKDFASTASEDALHRTVAALAANGMEAFVFEDATKLKEKLLELVPLRSEVMTMTSVTLEELGINDIINESGDYNSVRKRLSSLEVESVPNEKRKLGAGPEFTVGSVHAITENGEVMVASATGSQLPAYVYGSKRVIWVVGTQKIVKDAYEAMERIYKHCLPLEDIRAQKVYGRGSQVAKIMTIAKEEEGRITILFLKENIGF